MEIALWARYSSYAEFENAFNNYKRAKQTTFYINDCKTLEAAKKRNLRIQKAPDELKYYSIKFRCIHGGAFKKSKDNRGLRKTTTKRQGCPVFLNLRIGDDTKHLIISALCDVHNHVNPIPPTKKRRIRRSLRSSEQSEKPSKNTTHKSGESEAGLDFFYLLTNPGDTANEETNKELSQMFKVVPEQVIPPASQLVEENGSQELPKQDEVLVLEFPENEFLQIPSQSCSYKTDKQKLLRNDLVEMEREEHRMRMEVLKLQKQVQEEKLVFNRQLQYKQLEFENEKHKKMLELYETELNYYSKKNESD